MFDWKEKEVRLMPKKGADRKIGIPVSQVVDAFLRF